MPKNEKVNYFKSTVLYKRQYTSEKTAKKYYVFATEFNEIHIAENNVNFNPVQGNMYNLYINARLNKSTGDPFLAYTVKNKA